MSIQLKKQLILHILNKFGVFISARDSLLSDTYLLDKKLTFDTEDKTYSNNLWSGETEIEGSKVQFMIADLTEDLPEFAVILQLDTSTPYIMRISTDDEDSGSIYFRAEEHWIPASTIFQAKVLVAIESLFEASVIWVPNKNYESIHKTLISFLKFESE